jgi:glycosyltransferase involved in cell wall biosynthesis
MKFAYLCSDVEIPLFGSEGCSIHIREVVDALTELGHEVVLFCASRGDSERVSVQAPVYSFEPADIAGLALRYLQEEPVIQNHHLDRDLTALAFNWWMQGEGLSILDREKPDVLYERYALFGWAGLQVSRQRGLPLMLEVNSPLRREQTGYDKFVLTRMAELVELDVLRNAAAILPVSRWLKEWIVEQGVGPERIHVMPNGVAERHFVGKPSGDIVRERWGLNGKRVIGYVGSFQTWHDLSGLLEAFQELYREDPDLRLMLVGHGENHGQIARKVKAAGLSDVVILTGAVPFEAVPSNIAAMDVPVVPYSKVSDFYFSPIKLFECMAAGRPVVAAATGQIAEIVEHGKTGWLYEPGSTPGLIDGVRRLLYSPELGAQIGQAGRDLILANYTWKGIAKRIAELACDLTCRRKASLAQ